MAKVVTEQDFRMPEFRDAKPEDYEFRADGKIVRKDRWEVGMRNVASAMGFCAREGFEVEDVVSSSRDAANALRDIAKAMGFDVSDDFEIIAVVKKVQEMAEMIGVGKE